MANYLKRVFSQISDFLKTLSPGKKLAFVGTGIAIILGIALLFMMAGDTTFAPLMSNLNPEDSANIIRVLRDKHIPFKVDPSGRNISVPSESMDVLRLELATMGLPQSSVVGYEVFDKQTIGTTSFVQKLNQKRALEGELIRTVNTIKGVRRSRIHLAIPQKSAFVEDQKKSSASVVVDLEPGTVLNDKQVYGIANLVARAVEGMDIPDVVIVDSNGKVLSKNSSDPLAAATATQLDFQQKIETEMEKRIENILSHVVGEGHVVAKVTADLDFSQINETQTLYDTDGATVRSVERKNDSMSGTRPGPGGVAGAQSNLPNQTPPTPSEIKSNTSKNNEVTNYEIPQTIRKTTKPSGTIKRLSIAVLVDGKTIKTVGKDNVVQTKVEAWPPETLKQFETIVASTAGIDKKRGDILEIKNMDFTHEDFEEAQRIITEKEKKTYIQNLVIYGIIGMVVIFFFFYVVRPFIKWITENTIDSVDTFLPQTIEELEKLQATGSLPGLEEALPVIPEKVDPEKTEGEMIREKIITLVDANPHKAALILKDWMHDPKYRAKEPGTEGAKAKPAGGAA